VNDKGIIEEKSESAQLLGVYRGLADDQILMMRWITKKSEPRLVIPKLEGLRKVYQLLSSLLGERTADHLDIDKGDEDEEDEVDASMADPAVPGDCKLTFRLLSISKQLTIRSTR